jgi:hypothetical protein
MTRQSHKYAALIALFVALYAAHVVCQCSREPVQVRAS